jgi:quercetin dioxygenase-like cupin family protein
MPKGITWFKARSGRSFALVQQSAERGRLVQVCHDAKGEIVFVRAPAPDAKGEMRLFVPKDIEWKEGPPSLPKGAKIALLEGDPSREGLFTMRVAFPDGTVVAPHRHSQIEHVTVISGTLNLGVGEKFEREKTAAMPAGSFGHWPVGMAHFGWIKGDTVLQLHGRGPWTITYVNPADDPRLPHK